MQQLRVVSLVAFFLLTTCKATAGKGPYADAKEERIDPGNSSGEATSSTPDSNLNIEPTSHNSSQHSSRKDIVVQDPEQLKVLPGVEDIKDKRIRKLLDSFQQGTIDFGSPRKVTIMTHQEEHHVKNRGVQSVIHLLRLKALKAVKTLRRKIHSGKLPDLLSTKTMVNKTNNKTLSTQENLESSRNKLFKDVRRLIHRMILRQKKTQSLEVNNEKRHRKHRQMRDKAKAVEHSAEQHSRQKPARKAYNDRAKELSSHNVDEDSKSDQRKATSNEWGRLARQPLSTPPNDDDGKWANWLDLHQFFNQMKGLPMGNHNGDSLFGAQSWNTPSSPASLGGMMSPPASSAGLTSPLAGVEGFNANAPNQMLQQQQNQMGGMADYFNTQAQSRGGVQPALMSVMGNQPGLNTAPQGASYPTDLSSAMQMNNPLASFQPFLSRFYRPSMPVGATNPRFLERADDVGRVPYQDEDQDEQSPDWNRARDPEWNRARARARDDDEEEGPIPPDAYPDRDEEAPDNGDDGDDEENDDDDPYHRRQKSTIQFPLNQSKNQSRNVRQEKTSEIV